MKFWLYSALCVLVMMPFSVSAETDSSEENLTPKRKRSIWQRVFPRTGDIEGTVLQHGTDTPFVEAEVRIVETDQHQKTGIDGTFRFIEIPVGTYTLSISHPIYSTPTKIPIEIRAGEILHGKFYPEAEIPFVNTTDSGDINGYIYSNTTGKPLTGAEVCFGEIDVSGKTDASGNFQFIGIASGTYTLSITHPTHKTSTTTRIEVTAGDTAQVKIYLGAAIRLETVVVEGYRLPPTISRKEIRGNDLIRIPGTGRDALKGLTTLPSIGIPNDFY